MNTKNDSTFEWRLPGPVITDSPEINEGLEKYCYGDILIIPENLTAIDGHSGNIYFGGEKIGNKGDHPFCPID